MKNKTKHLASVCVLIAFTIFAVSSRVNKIHYGAFNYYNKVEDQSANYLEKNDGSRIYGDKITWKSGLFGNSIKIDEQKFKLAEVRGYLQNGTFYGRLGKDYIRRIVHGKISIYVQFTQVTTTSTDHGGFSHTSSYTRTDHYSQKGDSGPLEVFGSQKDMRALVEGCPLSEQMLDKSSRQIRRSIKQDHNFLNKAFEIYNNGCKPLGDDSTSIRLQQ